MLYLSILLVFSLSGVLMEVQSSDERPCSGIITEDQMERAVILRFKRNELRGVCRNVKRYIKCMDGVQKELSGFTFQQMSRNRYAPEHLVKVSQAFVNISNVFDDLCEENSPYQNAFKQHARCLSSITPAEERQCSDEATSAYQSYMRNRDDTYRRPTCMVQAYKTACSAAKINDDCGSAAFAVYERMMMNTLYFKLMMCSQYEVEELNDEFLKSLQLNDQHKYIYQKTYKALKDIQ